ncbi:MAG: Hsp20/alpha crystallin family protein [Alphaproteobacteria bacterium]|nr:Hsp20/alpha crystallin family protein [Alphaproteobacteria bacterium]
MDHQFDDFARGYRWPFANGRNAPMPQIDVSETDADVTIEAELPGVDEKDIDVTLTDNLLTIKGEKKQEKEEKNKDYHLTERSYGSFSRSMTLPFDADPKKIRAKFDAGVLKITLPKPAEVKAKVKKIAIGK